MIPGSANALLLGSAAGGYEISRSLRFNSADSAYLSRTPASAGNRKTWTWAGWVKKASNGASLSTFFSASSSGYYDGLTFGYNNTDTLALNLANAAGNGNDYGPAFETTQVFRDPSAWYHIVVALDTTQATASNRIKVYINGTQITTFATANYPALNYETNDFNTAQIQYLGAAGGLYSGRFFSGYLADIHFIDGQALDPTSFGEFDDNSIWQPIRYTGTYGTNGFHLDFSDNSAATAAALGADSSGNGNNWTPNNLTAGPAVISNSWSGYFDGSGDKLETPSIDIDTNAFCFECWLYPTVSQQSTATIFAGDATGSLQVSYYAGSGLGIASRGVAWQLTALSLPTLNAWNHVAFVRSGTGTNQTSIFLNGTRIGNGTVTHDYVASTYDFSGTNAGAGEFTGYMSNARLTIGSSPYDATQTTITVPTAPLTSITNTALLTMQDSTFIDNSPNAYTLTATGARISTLSPFEEPVNTDSLVDVPTNGSETDTGVGGEVRGNYCTLNPLAGTTLCTLSNGNLQRTGGSGNKQGTFGLLSGKWYWETTIDDLASYSSVGITEYAHDPSAYNLSYLYASDGTKFTYTNQASYGAAYTTGDIIGCAYDADNGSLVCYKNGSSQGTLITGLSGKTLFPITRSDGNVGMTVNFGQRPFAYTAPSGYKALCTANLPTPTIEDGSTAMDVVTYTGNGSTQTISGLGFSPDLVWTKARSFAENNNVFDTVRGATAILLPDATNAEQTVSGITAFNSDGYTVGSHISCNSSGQTYVAWTWDAGSSTVTNNDGTISSQVRANAGAGFSIVTWTGNGTNGATVGHGLGVSPGMVIVKSRSAAYEWPVYHSSLSAGTGLFLSYTGAAGSVSSQFNWGGIGAASSTTFTCTQGVTTINNTNANSATYVAYCFAPVAGYSAFGSYTGNGSADGPFVYTGFRPRWVLIKNSSVSPTDWLIQDTERSTYNLATAYLLPNSAGAEGNSNIMDVTSNGFKQRNTFTSNNASGNVYIYAAFAENPFALARAR